MIGDGLLPEWQDVEEYEGRIISLRIMNERGIATGAGIQISTRWCQSKDAISSFDV